MDHRQEPDQSTIFNTRVLMITSAVFLAIPGIMGTFLPHEILHYYGYEAHKMNVILINITGALYLGFAILNWMARGNPIGGIYSRPVALGNFFHFVLIAIPLLKFLIIGSATTLIATAAVIYAIFAVCFGYLLFANGKACA